MPFAVILDTVSIQNFIFSTNNLKENLGASHLVKWIYDEPLREALEEVCPQFDDVIFDSWNTNPDSIQINQANPVEIGYIGGGNALILFNDYEMAENFIRKWSLRLLIHTPSLIPAAAVDEMDLSSEKFEISLKRLFKKLAENKARFTPTTTLPRHGITAECRRTGLSREMWADELPDDEKDYISCVSYSKIMAAKSASREHDRILKEIEEAEQFSFTDSLEELGQQKGKENYIAIVHIDGNDMSLRFRSCKTLSELRNLSISVREATLKSFKKMLKTIIENINNMKNEFKLIKKDGKTIIPLRPIIIGGDDITFVCDGRLGIWLAKVFLENFERQSVFDRKSLSACAGVSITKTKYPFYRGYQISEELLRSAKSKRKEKEDDGSWIDFHISSGGISGRLKDIRDSQYKTTEADLLMRPFSLSELKDIIKATKTFHEEDERGRLKFPRSKLYRIREAIYSTEAVREKLIMELQSSSISLPQYKNDFDGERLILNKKTPYLDMIELSEFYPKFALEEV